MEDSTGDESDGIPQTPIHSAASSVLNTLSHIRRSPQLRQSFVSGNRAHAAMNEVRDIFRGKGRKSVKKSKVGKSKGKRKKRYFKHIIGCFSGPEASMNLSRNEWEDLSSVGLGKAWKGHAEACIPADLTAKEFHALLISMFPALQSTPYELCRLGGAYNNEVNVIDGQKSVSDVTFKPQWSPDALRPLIGKAQLFVRPRRCILKKAKELRIPKVMQL